MQTKASFLKLVIVLFLIAFYSNSIAQKSDTLQIPFIERFTEGSLEINNWTTDSDNWEMQNQEGKPSPSVRFNGNPQINTEYDCSLTSDWISTANWEEKKDIALRFNYKFVDINSTLNEKLFVEVFDSVEWHTIWELSQIEGGWRLFEREITTYLTNNHIKIRFRVNGINSSDIEYWGIDNIYVYENVRFSDNLEGNYFWDEDFGVKLDWHYEQPVGVLEPLTWCDWPWENCSGVGVGDGGSFSFAAKWNSVFPYDEMYLEKINCYIWEPYFDSLVLNIWRGQNGDILQYSRNVTSETEGDALNHYFINPPIILTDSSPTFIGFTIHGQTPFTFPAGLACGSTTVGFGNLIKLNGNDSWDTLSNYGIDGNWLILANFNLDTNSYYFRGYNIYRKEEMDTSYKIMKYLGEPGSGDITYLDKYPNVDFQKSYSYKVTNVFVRYNVNPLDTIESLPAYATNSDDDFVIVLVTSIPENENNSSNISTYPNPAKTILNLKSENKIKTVFIFNLIGQMVREVSVNNEHQTRIDVSDLKNGVYLIKIETAVGVFTKKIVIE